MVNHVSETSFPGIRKMIDPNESCNVLRFNIIVLLKWSINNVFHNYDFQPLISEEFIVQSQWVNNVELWFGKSLVEQ